MYVFFTTQNNPSNLNHSIHLFIALNTKNVVHKLLIKVVQEVKACKKHDFVQSQSDRADRSSFHPSMPEE